MPLTTRCTSPGFPVVTTLSVSQPSLKAPLAVKASVTTRPAIMTLAHFSIGYSDKPSAWLFCLLAQFRYRVSLCELLVSQNQTLRRRRPLYFQLRVER